MVILIDEYDKPLIDNLDNPKRKDIRSVLEGFYSVVKATEPFQHFVLLTGGEQVLPGLGVLQAQQPLRHQHGRAFRHHAWLHPGELEANFADRIELAARWHGGTKAELLDRLREWYNGYRFHPECARPSTTRCPWPSSSSPAASSRTTGSPPARPVSCSSCSSGSGSTSRKLS